MSSQRNKRGEKGSALVLALVFITVIGLLIGAVLTLVETSLKYSAVARSGRGELYAADGAMEAAIARKAGGGPCGDSTTTLNGVKVDVTCEPAPRPPPPPPELAPSPAHAILTLGPQGLQQAAGSEPVGVRGDVFSHSVVANGSTSDLTVQGDVAAVGDCSGKITAMSVRCSNRPAGDPAPADPASGADPAYPSDLSAVPAPQLVPNCSASSWLVKLAPGYYDEAGALSRLTAGADPGCAGKVIWFQPGVYYFNFNFSSTGPTCDQVPTLCTWLINDPDVNVVGGEPLDWDPGLSDRPTINLPGGCLREEKGVQLVFGGQSRLEQKAGKVELCPRTTQALPPATVYGLKQGEALERTVTNKPTTVSGTTGFLTPENARAVDEKPVRLTSDATLTVPPATPPLPLAPPPPPPPPPASLTVGGFGGTPIVPLGSRVAEVKLRVVHRETGDLGDLKAKVSTADGQVAGSPFTVPRCAASDPSGYCDFPIVLKGVSPSLMSSLSVTYEVSPAAPATIDPLTGAGTSKVGTESLDGIVLDVKFTPPALEALRGCLVRPYGPAPATGCALFKTSGDRSLLAVGGTVYAPTAAVDLDLVRASAPVLTRGIITSSLRLKVTAGYLGPVVALPEIDTKRALLALGNPGDGVVQTAESGKTLIRGDVFSQSVVANQSTTASLAVQGTVAAVGACTGTIDVKAPPNTPKPKRCQNNADGPVAPTEGTDPLYPAAVETAPALPVGGLPPCAGKQVVQLKPGYYDDAVALSGLTTGGLCKGKVVWLQPGVYYFNFNFAGTGPTCAADPSLCTWKIDDAALDVVGGAIPKNADGTPVWDAGGGVRPTIPGGCSNESGVQLIFGGQSRLHQLAGDVELCPYRKSKLAPAIPLYGLARGTPNEQARSFPPTANSTVNFSNPTNAYRINEQPSPKTADATSPAPATSGTITMSGFGPVPDGKDSRSVSASLRIAHREAALTGVQTVTVVDSSGAPLASELVPLCTTTEFCEQRIPLPSITAADQLVGITATYQVTLTGLAPVTANLDGIELEVRSTPPSFEALSGCHLASPRCALLKSEGAESKLVLGGTVYAPTATLDLDLQKLSSPIVDDGLIAGSVRLNIKPAACYTGPAISHLDAQFPSDAPGPPEAGEVFTACIGGNPVLRARVSFPAPPQTASPPAQSPPAEPPKVESWSVLR